MPSLDDITIPLEPDKSYHIFNRGNEGRPIFFQDKNYQYFLDKYKIYMNGYFDTHAYCLLPNHFHLAVRLKNQNDILQFGKKHFSNVSKSYLKEHWPKNIEAENSDSNYQQLSNQAFLSNYFLKEDVSLFLHRLAIWTVSERFRRFLLGYAKAINVQQKRHGSLFQKLFRRKLIPTGFSRSLIAYIHRNPVHHGYCSQLENYRWSSYLPLLESNNNWLAQKEVIDHFEGALGFKHSHQNRLDDWQVTQSLLIEE